MEFFVPTLISIINFSALLIFTINDLINFFRFLAVYSVRKRKVCPQLWFLIDCWHHKKLPFSLNAWSCRWQIVRIQEARVLLSRHSLLNIGPIFSCFSCSSWSFLKETVFTQSVKWWTFIITDLVKYRKEFSDMFWRDDLCEIS